MARTAGSHAQTTWPRVREAALRLIAKHGFAAVSMRQIAAEVGLQAGALYSYTKDKQALLFHLMFAHMEELLEVWDEQPQGGTPTERLERWVRFHVSYHVDRQDRTFISYMELRSLSPDNFEKLEVLRRRYEAIVETILKDGQDAGVFQVSEVRLAAMAVISMLNGVTVWYKEGGRLSRDQVEALYVDMVRRSVMRDAALIST